MLGAMHARASAVSPPCGMSARWHLMSVLYCVMPVWGLSLLLPISLQEVTLGLPLRGLRSRGDLHSPGVVKQALQAV